MVKILRLPRHSVTPVQLEELRRIYGDDAVVMEVSETVLNAARVKELVQEYEAQVLEAVLPLPLLADLLNPRFELGVPVIRAVMDRWVGRQSRDVKVTFSHYEVVTKVEVVTERL